MRVAIASLLQETNTFSSQRTRLEHFHLARGPELIPFAGQERTEVQGFLDALHEGGIEPHPLIGGWAVSSGRIERADFDQLAGDLLGRLEDTAPVDGVLLALHGAWAAVDLDSADGLILKRVREVVGPDVPVIATLDLHASLARSMWQSADALIGYRTCPHVDTYETGLRAGRLLVSSLKQQHRPVMTVRKLPMVTQAEQMLSDRGVLRQLLDEAQTLEDGPGVLSVSLFLCQPWLDVEELGWAVVVITDDDRGLAESIADRLSREVWSCRHHFVEQLPDVDTALDRAMAIEGGPVTLGDGADATMGGSPGDSVHLLAGILRKKLDSLPTAAVVVDPEAVDQAIEAGLGQTVTLTVGGKLNPEFSHPITVTGKVQHISDGEFRMKGSVYTGRKVHMGRAVVLTIHGIRLLIAERSMPTTDPELYRSQGIEPREMKLVLVKSPVGVKLEYESISKAVISVDTPGCCSSDLTRLPFSRIPRPLFPFDDIEWSPSRTSSSSEAGLGE